MLNKLKTYIRTFYFSLGAITILAVSVLLFSLFWGNGLFEPKTDAKKIYYADNISPTHKLLINKFNEKYKGKIEVVPINLPFEKFGTNERKELLIRYLRSKSDRIDIFSVDQIWVPRFAKWTEPLNKYFTQRQLDQITEIALKTCFYKNELVALPVYLDVSMLYVNEDFLKTQHGYQSIKKQLENFITWEDFLELRHKLKVGQRPFYLYPADDFEGIMCSFVELLENQDTELFEGQLVRLTTPEAEKALTLLVNLVHKYHVSPPSVVYKRENECYYTYLTEDGVFLRGWAGLDVWYNQNIGPGDISSKYSLVPLPHFKNGKPVSILGGWNMMLSRHSANKMEAIEFIKYVVSEEAQKLLLKNGGYFPVAKNIYTDKNIQHDFPEINFYNRIIHTCNHRPFLDKYTKRSDVISYYLNKAIRQEIGIKEALATAEKIINSGEIFIK